MLLFCLVCPPPWQQGGPNTPLSMPLVGNNEICIIVYNLPKKAANLTIIVSLYLPYFGMWGSFCFEKVEN